MSLLSSLSSLGLGYSIAIALGFLVLFASLLLASYLCFRRGGGDYWAGEAATTASSSGHLSITVPRVLFVAEGSESPDAAYSSAAAASCSPVGLDRAAIASYPKVPFSSRAAEPDAMCSICLSEYRDGEMLRVMPECRHGFHVACLDAWLRRSGSCPVCRSSPIPTPTATPLATPLSELVPLSHYAADRRRRNRPEKVKTIADLPSEQPLVQQGADLAVAGTTRLKTGGDWSEEQRSGIVGDGEQEAGIITPEKWRAV